MNWTNVVPFGLSLGLAVAALCGCATPVANYSASVQAFSRPPLRSVSTVSIGEEMVAQGSTADQDGIELLQPLKVSWAYTLSSGFYPKTGSDDKSAYYSFAYVSAPVPGYGVLSKAALADPPQAIKTDPDGAKVCVVTVFNLYVCNDGARATIAKRAISSENAFQQTLIYNGRVGSKINIGYREFYGSTARPAFNNNVEYDLTASDIIAYRGARLRIIEANNNGITYELLSNFNSTPR